jgi:arylamine N-acetyltransferase
VISIVDGVNAKVDTPSILLEPHQHDEAVRLFMSHFDLRLRRPELSFLQEIIEHFAAIPYENISKIIKLNQHWDAESKLRLPEEIINDHISFHLGGTCFSLTFFLQTILTLNDFTCYPVMADMHVGRNSHCCLVTTIDGRKYLIDPGYLLHQPLEIDPARPRLYRTSFAGVQLHFDSTTSFYNLSTFDANETKWRYRFQDRPTPVDEVFQHWHASCWKSTLHGILLTKVMPEGLIYVHKTLMKETSIGGKKNINIKKNYHAAIHDLFHIDPQLIEKAQAALKENLAKEKASGMFSCTHS